MDSELAPYPIEDYKKWCGLSNFISRDALKRLNPFCGFVDSVCDYTPKVDENNRSELDKDGLPILSQVIFDTKIFLLTYAGKMTNNLSI